MAPYWSMQIAFPCLTQVKAVLSCLLLAVAYVGSLYVWKRELPRDHPKTIKQRTLSVFVVCAAAPLFLLLISSEVPHSQGLSLCQHLGVRNPGLLAAITVPLVLTMVLFLGPLYMLYLDGSHDVPFVERGVFGSNIASQMVWLRNYLIAPFTEEFVFRACMLPLLVPCFGCPTAVIVCPLFFGVAHIHHIIERLRFGSEPLSAIILTAFFQSCYTTVFGAYSAFLFVRTGHLAGPFICHSFCNYMGFPEIGHVFHHSPRHRAIITATFIFGLVTFLFLLYPLTTPSWYVNAMCDSRSEEFSTQEHTIEL
ncbi:CAAX prenyl protease 2 [Strongylocentrotus purpuratus]|uniref:CAAX prenyl protease 2 n=1 Tax=Strongylocentrotus purpuratus TaxID=7668 RepID=A0A7M7T4Y7_STRPU|nr:CAAX prenyl protease 2 [Strongylocentrotus purpuratus]